MAKPSITKRSVKGAALTYSELDTNFQNLADATLSVTAGTGGTQITSDLNGNITLVAGSNITLTGDNTAKTITIASTASGGVTNPMTADLDLGGYKIISSSNGHIELQPNGYGDVYLTADTIRVGDANNVVNLTSNGTGSLVLSTNNTITSSSIQIDNGASSSIILKTGGAGSSGTAGIIAIDCGLGGGRIESFQGNLYLSPQDNINDNVQIENCVITQNLVITCPVSMNSGNTFRLSNFTTTERNNISSPQDGMLIYNSTTGTFQGRAAGSWVDLN